MTCRSTEGKRMHYDKKCKLVAKELASSGIRQSNSNPPLLKLLRKVGVKVVPPHYRSFFSNALSSGAYFGPVWGILMYFMLWRYQGLHLVGALTSSCLAGLIFGICMASYYKYSARINKLTPWEDL